MIFSYQKSPMNNAFWLGVWLGMTDKMIGYIKKILEEKIFCFHKVGPKFWYQVEQA